MSTRYLMLALIPFVVACGKSNQGTQQAPGAIPVSTTTVAVGSATYYDEHPALVRALNEVTLRAQVNGYITGIHFTEGEKVKKGQKLYSIDPQQSQASYQQALANLALQEANLEKAEKDLKRYRELGERDAIAKQQLDYAETAYSTAKHQVEAAQAAVANVQTNVRYTTIVAPFDGIIGISQVKLGAAVTPGQTILNTISSDNPIGVDVAVDQHKIFRFSTMLASGETGKADSIFQLAFRNERYPHYGTLSLIDRAVDPHTGTIKMRIEFPNPDGLLRDGMSGTLRVKSKMEKALLIPHKAVVELLGEFFVYVVTDGTASQRRIHTGRQIGTDVVVLNGLSEGEVIVTEGVQNLREGAAVVAANSKSQPTQ